MSDSKKRWLEYGQMSCDLRRLLLLAQVRECSGELQQQAGIDTWYKLCTLAKEADRQQCKKKNYWGWMAPKTGKVRVNPLWREKSWETVDSQGWIQHTSSRDEVAVQLTGVQVRYNSTEGFWWNFGFIVESVGMGLKRGFERGARKEKNHVYWVCQPSRPFLYRNLLPITAMARISSPYFFFSEVGSTKLIKPKSQMLCIILILDPIFILIHGIIFIRNLFLGTDYWLIESKLSINL